MAAEDIQIKVVADTKGLKERISQSNLPQSAKDILTSRLSETLRILEKGAAASGKELNIASGNIRKIINELVKAAAGAQGLSQSFINAQKKLEKAQTERAKAAEKLSEYKRTKIDPKSGNIRASEIGRIIEREKPTRVDKAGNEVLIKSFDALQNQAKANNAEAERVLKLIQSAEQQYKADMQGFERTITNSEQEIQTIQTEMQSSQVDENTDSVAIQIQEFGNELQKLIESIKDVRRENLEQEVDKKDPGVNISTQKTSDALSKPSGAIGKAFKQFSLYAIALKTIKTAAREAVSTIKELDKSLTEQAMVTGKTRKQTYQLLGTYQQLATATGATTKEIAELATQFMRQGKTTQDAITLTEAAMSAAKVAGISAAESVNYLTTALNGFQMAAKDAMLVSDKFAAIAANSATSYDEIATALSKVASQANLAGMSIDYTTALLAKGLETTREAPETMGTALKTVIARMREIKDYGETLEGDTDVNNVESQLAYVGIQLKDNNGELRSTEDVLDELGKKWDTLNSNQQAAIAKSLAGTRQQSRLIAMMTDYERVIELQEISIRSEGATAAQMSVYLEGMDAALNRFNTAWETLITSLTNNKVIIGLVDAGTFLLDVVSNIASNVALLPMVLVPLSVVLLAQLKLKIQEYALSIQQNESIRKQQKAEAELNVKKAESLLLEKQKEKAVKEQLRTTLIQLKDEGKLTAEQAAELAVLDKEIPLLNEEINKAKEQVSIAKDYDSYLTQQHDIVSNLTTGWGSLGKSIGTIATQIFPMLTAAIQKTINATKKHTNEMKKNGDQAQANGTKNAGNSAAQMPVIGWIAWAVIMGLPILATIVSWIQKLTSLMSNTEQQATETAQAVYNLNEKNLKIDGILKKYDSISQKAIKTKEDVESLNETLASGRDLLTEEQQKEFDTYDAEGQLKYLAKVQEENEKELQKKREKARKDALKRGARYTMGGYGGEAVTYDAKMEEDMGLRINTQTALLGEVADIQDIDQYKFATDFIKSLSTESAYKYLHSGNIKNIITSVNQEQLKAITSAESYADRAKAYQQVIANASDDIKDYINKLYPEVAAFVDLGQETLNLVDKYKINADDFNSLVDVFGKPEDVKTFLKLYDSGKDLKEILTDVFNLKGDDLIKALNAINDAIGDNVLNIGQEIEKSQAKINTLYETMSKWNTLSNVEQSQFLSEYQDLFTSTNGAELYKAFMNGDYNKLRQLLISDASNDTGRMELIQKIINSINTERAKGDQANLSIIAYYEDQLKVLQNVSDYYSASLEKRLDQEEKYLSAYKDYLSEQKDALVKSLEERKDAYQNYFDAVNEQAEDEDFFKQEDTLINNIAKLSTSTSAAALNKTAELEAQLRDLEEERLKTLRERAQEALIQSIDDEVQKVNENLEKLLNSQQALLMAMTSELENPSEFIANYLSSGIKKDGLTELGAMNLINTARELFSMRPELAGFNWDDISVEQRGNTLYLNIAGQQIDLSQTDQNDLFNVIATALGQKGYTW